MKILIILLGVLCSPYMVFANQVLLKSSSQNRFYITGAIGYNIPLTNGTQDVQMFNSALPPLDRYMATKDTGGFFSSIEVGRVLHLQTDYPNKLAVGMAVQVGELKEKGDVIEYNVLNNYEYHEKGHFISVLALVHLPIFALVKQHFTLSIFLGLGSSYNSATEYTERPKENAYPRNVAIANKSQWDFAYAAGVSLQQKINSHTSIKLIYEYLDAGEAAYGQISTSQAHGPVIKLRNNIITLGLQYKF